MSEIATGPIHVCGEQGEIDVVVVFNIGDIDPISVLPKMSIQVFSVEQGCELTLPSEQVQFLKRYVHDLMNGKGLSYRAVEMLQKWGNATRFLQIGY